MQTQTLRRSKKKMKRTDKQRINPFLWFDSNAEQAVNFYISTFMNSKIDKVTRYEEQAAKATGREKGSVMTIDFSIEGQKFAAINGGPVFKISPTISFFLNCDNTEEINRLWSKLSDGGTVRMALDKYPFSERYGWVEDRFGVSWQLILPGRAPKIETCFMFTGSQHKRAEEAINFFISVFGNSATPAGKSEIIQLERYIAGQGPEGAVIHSKFELDGQEFIAMDSHMVMNYEFNPAISLVVNCKTQDEIDYYWEKLSAGGDERARQCGWLADKFGISWQIIPDSLGEIMSNPEKAERAMMAILQMKKIDMKMLQRAVE